MKPSLHLTRREFFGWMALAAVALAAVAVCASLAWAVVPHTPRVLLGTVEDFPEGRPGVWQASDDHPALYLVRLEGTPVVWDARAPLAGRRCRYVWVPTNTRFEDPCSGNKWCLDGTLADNRFGQARTLDRYEVVVDGDGQVWLRPDRPVRGTPMPGVHEIHSTRASSNYTCDHLR